MKVLVRDILTDYEVIYDNVWCVSSAITDEGFMRVLHLTSGGTASFSPDNFNIFIQKWVQFPDGY